MSRITHGSRPALKSGAWIVAHVERPSGNGGPLDPAEDLTDEYCAFTFGRGADHPTITAAHRAAVRYYDSLLSRPETYSANVALVERSTDY